MSSAGVPQSGLAGVLNLVRPDLAAEQMALQRRQAFAQSLLSQQPQYSGIGGAADNFGSKILGAFLQRNADKKNLDIAKEYRDALFNPQGAGMAPQPQAQGSPPLGSLPPQAIPPMLGQPNSGATAQPLPPLGSMPQGGLPAPPQGSSAPQMTQQQQQPMAQPQGQRPQSLFDQAVPDIPGVDPRNKFALYAADPTNYMKAYYDRTGQTNEYRNALAATGGDPQAAQQLMQAQAVKNGTLEFREKGFGVLPGGKVIYGPNEESNTYFTTGPNNEPIAHPIQGGAAVAADQAGQVERAKEVNKILPDVELSTGARVPMFAGEAVNGGQQTNLNANNPLNLQPGGVEKRFTTPTAGFGEAWDNLSHYGKQGINTVSGIMNTWAPYQDKSGNVINPNTPQNIQRIAAQMKVDPNQPLDMGNSNVKGTLIDLMKPTETGSRYQSPNSSTPQQSPSVGESTAQKKVNEATGEAASGTAHVNATTQSTLQAIDGLIGLNDRTPDSTVLPADWKAAINKRLPGVLKGDAGALAQWEQLNSQSIVGGLKSLQGLGRLDLPEVNQIIKGNGIPADLPRDQRLQLLQNLKTALTNARASTQNNLANLNQPGLANTAQSLPVQGYGQQRSPQSSPQKIRVYNPKTQRIEDQ